MALKKDTTGIGKKNTKSVHLYKYAPSSGKFLKYQFYLPIDFGVFKISGSSESVEDWRS